MPIPPGLSPKDADQVIRAVMDDSVNRLRVDAIISPDGSDISIHHEDDSIAIGTPTELFTSTTVGSQVGLDVNIINSLPLEIDISASSGDNIAIADQTGTNFVVVNPDGSLNITDNGGSITVDGTVAVSNFPAVQDVNVVSSVEIEIANDAGNPIPVSGTVTANAGTGNFTIVQPSGANLHVNVDNFPATQDVNIVSTITLPVSGPLTDAELRATPVPVSGTVAVTQGTSPWIIGDGGGSLTVDNNGTFAVQAAQSGAWSVNVNNAAGASAVNIQDGGNSITVDAVDLDIRDLTHVSDSVKVGDGTDFLAINPDGSINITDNGGSLTVDGTVTVNQGTSPWVVSGTVTATPTGIQDVNVVSSVEIEIKNDVGNPIPVSGTVAATQSGTWNINNITGTVSLPTGAATAAGQTQPGVDIGDVTVNNGAGAAAVNIQDGGNSITVDGTVTVNQGTSPWVTSVSNFPATVAVTQSTSPWVVSGTVSTSNFPTTVDTNYGTVGANTIRTASQIGNATGAANFNVGATGAQTLRVEANQGEPNAVADAWPTTITDGVDTVTVTAGGELNVIATAQPGVDIGDVTVNNAAGAAAVNIQDGGNSITVDGTVSVSNFPTTVDTNYGTVGANTIRTASQIGNATGAADFNAGATGAQTLRVTANAGTGNFTVVQPTGTNLHTVVDSFVTGIFGFQGSFTDRSGSATSTSSVVAAANAARKYFYIQNTSGATIWMNFGVAAVTASPSISLAPNDHYILENNFISTQSINIIAGGGTRTYTAKEG